MKGKIYLPENSFFVRHTYEKEFAFLPEIVYNLGIKRKERINL